MKNIGWIVATGLVLATVASAQSALPHPTADAQALDLAKRAIALRSVAGPGNKTPEVAALYKAALVAGGFADRDVEITAVGDTAYLIGTWPGTDPRLKPLVISGHMDVVEAKPSDWQRDPFVPVVENGYLYGRGATDMKLDGSIAIAALTELRRQGYKPRRTIVIEFSGDEETAMKTSAIIAEKLKNADLVLNIDGGGGVLDEKTGKPEYFTWQGAEKTYADFEITITNPGGHSSAPRIVNAIVQMSRALERIGAYRFKPELSPLTRTALTAAAPYEEVAIGKAMLAFVANPADQQAIATLVGNPSTVGRIGTTCVPTMVSGGHALNALPQKVVANINCRIFPGHKPADIMAELQRAAAEPAASFKDVTEGSVPNDASPMRADFIAAVEKAMHKIYPGLPVFPSQASGASDSMWFRYHNVPSYGASPTFLKESDDFSHGLNERTPVMNIAPGITYYLSLFADLSK
ncbi:M20/M25/M40 family metallo-hydrolase [Sphingomonas panacisoli]|uniref:M20/M25/M40 family metallo-hydrolase n=1 Tax=Sphingomonas panacisoli TaxID=1813879 RepID=A0A5B8LJW0_9SPHN|nr:M20/M25/M40 family metallo-hydrolase [Sphingomonas panacisoli]QDZ07874.1 M20/M25/M40 family metallo-hydrolase [Sphingomonas panacisoli]